MEKTDVALARIYADFSGRPAGSILTLMSEDRILTADEAKNWNLITRIRGGGDPPEVDDGAQARADISETELEWMRAQAIISGAHRAH